MGGGLSWRFRAKPERAKRNCGARFGLHCRNSRRSKVFPQTADPNNRSILSEALVDPRIYPAPAQPDLAPDSSNSGESVDYLRRLKGAMLEGAPADAVARGGGVPAAGDSNAWKERRQSPRLRCSGSAEIRTEG